MHQCEFADFAYQDLRNNLSDTRRAFYSLQAFLIACANISKILWPVVVKYNGRGSELVSLLSIDETKSVLKRRDPRNHLEHFDERLHIWFDSSTHHNIMDMSIGPSNMVSGPIDFMRFFNTDNFSFRFRNDEYEIEPMIKELRELYMKVKSQLDKPVI
jgi:hypothetical protein